MERAESTLDAVLDAISLLSESRDVFGMVSAIVEQTVSATRADAAGLLLLDGTGTLQVVAGVPEETSALEIHELARHHRPVGLTDLTRIDAHSPSAHFAEAARGMGMRASVSVAARVVGHRVGELTLLWRTVPADALRIERIAGGGGTLIATALASSILDSSLLRRAAEDRVAARITLEQAKGMVAARHRITIDVAGRVISDFAAESDQSIDTVARHVVDRTMDLLDLQPPGDHP